MNNPYAQTEFLKSAARVDQLPEDRGFEVAFAGRSNAGKSSALNVLTENRRLARTSKTPGRTQLINVFTVQDDQHRLIDLPGYGYAKVSQRLKADWQVNLAHYLEVRQSLRGLILVMDIRHPLKTLDQRMIDWSLARGLPVHALLTKADKIGRGAASSAVLALMKQYAGAQGLLTAQSFSSLKKTGVEELIGVIDRWFGLR